VLGKLAPEMADSWIGSPLLGALATPPGHLRAPALQLAALSAGHAVEQVLAKRTQVTYSAECAPRGRTRWWCCPADRHSNSTSAVCLLLLSRDSRRRSASMFRRPPSPGIRIRRRECCWRTQNEQHGWKETRQQRKKARHRYFLAHRSRPSDTPRASATRAVVEHATPCPAKRTAQGGPGDLQPNSRRPARI